MIIIIKIIEIIKSDYCTLCHNTVGDKKFHRYVINHNILFIILFCYVMLSLFINLYLLFTIITMYDMSRNYVKNIVMAKLLQKKEHTFFLGTTVAQKCYTNLISASRLNTYLGQVKKKKLLRPEQHRSRN